MLNIFKKRDKAEGESVGDERNRVFLYVGDSGWQAAIVDLHKERETRLIGDEGEAVKFLADLKDPAQTGQMIEAMFRTATDALRKHEITKIADIRIVFDDPRTLYTDTLPDLFSSASTATLHEYGRSNLYCKSVSYGVARFGPGDRGHGRTHGGVIAFVDASRLGGFLSRLDRQALKVMTVAPVADILVRQMADRHVPSAALHVGALSSTMVVANPVVGAVVVRSLPFGVGMLARLLADGNGVSLEETMKSLGEQDLVSGLRAEAADDREAITDSAVERILGGSVRGFLSDILGSVDFFEEQRCAGRPSVLEVFGEYGRVRGFERVLAEQLPRGPAPLRISFSSKSVLELFQEMPITAPLNLLSEAGGDLKIGAATYTFNNNRLRPAADVKREVAAREAATRPAALAAATPRRPSRRGAAPPAATSLLARLRQLGSKTKADNEPLSEEDAAAAAADRQGFLVLLLMVMGIGYLLYQNYGETRTRYQAMLGSLSANASENVRVQEAVAQGGGQFQVAPDVDKVLWTEKVIAVSKHMNNEIWLTDMYLKSDSRTVDKTTITSKKLVMEGAVLPSTDGHIQKIADYIEKLQNDKDLFMSDFKDISFQGLSIDASETDQVVRFSIEAWYDEAKGQQMRQKSSASSNGGGALDRMNQSIGQHNQRLEKAAPGLGTPSN